MFSINNKIHCTIRHFRRDKVLDIYAGYVHNISTDDNKIKQNEKKIIHYLKFLQLQYKKKHDGYSDIYSV